ncbi:MAG: HAD-IB family phosphatase [Candidatus Aenigmatarchaeota archaeon]
MKVICFDFDDVIVRTNTIHKLIKLFGQRLKIFELEIEFLEDNLEPKKFFGVVKRIVMMGKGLEFKKIKNYMLKFGVNKGVKHVFKFLKSKNYKIVIVSTNDQRIIKDFLKKNHIDKYIDQIYAAKLGIKNGLLTGKIYGDVIKTEKTGIVKKIEKKYKIKKEDIIYIGDGLTDLPIIKLVGRGILFCPNELAKAEVFIDKTLKKKEKNGKLFLVEKKDMREILKFVM